MTIQSRPGDIAWVVVALEFETVVGDKTQLDMKWLPVGVVGMGRVK